MDSAPTVPRPAAPGPPPTGAAAAPLRLSIVMPCLNEAETVASCIRKAQQFLATHRVAGEVIVADNGSTDGSAALARQAGARVVPAPIRGYGGALQAGIAAARGQFIVMGDADDSYDFGALESFLEALEGGCDLVMGNRFAGAIQPQAMPRLHRLVGNPLLSGLGRLFFRSPVRDFHCGLRGFSKAAYARLDLQTMGMEFASEMVVKASLLGLRIAEVPVTLAPAGRTRPPHLRTWRDGWRHLRFMLLYSPRWLFLYPGFALMLAGLSVGLWLAGGPRSVGSVVLDVHTLLYAALAMLIGAQSVWFAILARAFATRTGLLPAQGGVPAATRWLTLEWGLGAGALLIVAGLAGSLYAVGLWSQQSFGPLEPTRVLRTIIPAILALTLGCQVVLGSFFLSILGLPRRGTPPEAQPAPAQTRAQPDPPAT
ncbi:MAG: glycosyltransferase family 2 protein [Verrucomicrobia bacterium]|nr:glycosyltransferase family 2 protein [Verrucomicrobiota bacterium]